MKKFAKILILLLTAIMALCLSFAVACGDDDKQEETTASSEVAKGNEKDPQDTEDENGEQTAGEEQPTEDNAEDPLPGAERPDRRPAPDATTAILSSVEKIVKEPANFSVNVTADGKTLSGLLYVDLHTAGSLSGISLEKAEMRASFGDVNLWFEGGSLYAAAGDLKVSATLQELVKLIGSGSSATADADIIGDLFGGRFAVGEDRASLDSVLNISGLEVPVSFGFDVNGRNDFTLTDIKTGISAPEIDLSAELSICEGEAPAGLSESDKENFVGIGEYAYELAQILKSQYLNAELSYSRSGGLEVSGKICVNTATLEVSGKVTVKYGNFLKTFGVIYKNGCIYLSADGLKLKVSAEESLEMVKSLLPAEILSAAGSVETDGLLQKVMGLKIDEYLAVSEEDGALQLVLKGTGLLEALGLGSADIGDIYASVKGGKIYLSALGVKAEISKGSRFRSDVSGYYDVTPVLMKIPELLEAGAVKFNGNVKISAEGAEVGVELNDGAVSWKNGIEVYLDLTLASGDAEHDVLLCITETCVTIAYGEVGARINYEELPMLEEALLTAYNRVRELSVKVAGEEYNPLPEIGGTEDLVSLFKEGGAAASALESLKAFFEDFDLSKLLGKIEFGVSEYADGILRLGFGGLSADILNELDKDGYLGLQIGYSDERAEIAGELHADILSGGIPAMPGDIEYLGAAQFADLIDYAVAAINTVCRPDVTLSFRGSVEGKYKNISADLTYHSPAGFPLTLNMEGKSVRFDAQAYINFDLKLEGETSETESLYLNIAVIDGVAGADGAPVADGILDFYVSLSRYGADENAKSAGSEYKPLSFHATADEVLTLLSGALVMAGADDGIIDDFFITKWITDLDEKARLEACGNAILPILGKLLGGEAVPGEEGVALMELDGSVEEARRGFLKKFACGQGAVELVVDTGSPESKFELYIGKTQADNGESVISLLSEVRFDYGAGKIKGNLNVTYDEVTPAVLPATYDFAGADELLLALARSVTHGNPVSSAEIISGEEEPHTYSINNYYYIDGEISASLFKIVNVKIDLVAISVTVDENGIPAVNIRLEYGGLKVLVTAINGDSTVDITIKDGMVYMRREQTTYFDGLIEKDCDEILYRAMPLDNFFGDILNQLGFILNFGDMITDQIAKADTSSDGGSEGDGGVAVKDYGAIVGEVLNAYVCKTSESGAMSWALYLNGSSFSKGILGEFDIELSEDANGLIRELKVTKCEIIPVKGLTIDATLELVWHNAGGVMSEGVEDKTADISAVAASSENGMGAMIEKLTAENGWAARKFIEGKEVTVNFVVDALDGSQSELRSQSVMVSTGADGLDANTLYGRLVYPEAADDDKVYDVWTEYAAGDVLPSDLKIHAVRHKQIYTVKFYSSEKIEGWNEEADGRYSYTAEMEYGSTVTFTSLGAQYAEPYTVTAGENAVEVPKAPGLGWDAEIGLTGAAFNALYEPDAVIYRSGVEFELDGAVSKEHTVRFTDITYELITPEAEGYIFLGWFEKTESGWRKITSLDKSTEGSTVTVEALWAKPAGVGLTAGKSYQWTKVKWNYTATATLNEITFVGAMADEVVSGSVEYKFNLSDRAAINDSAVQNGNVYNSSTGYIYYEAWVEVTAVFTLGENEFTITQQSDKVSI